MVWAQDGQRILRLFGREQSEAEQALKHVTAALGSCPPEQRSAARYVGSLGWPVGLMNFENILFEKKGAIAYVTVNRPKVLNALNMATMEELRAAFHDIKNDDAVRVVILTGSGKKAFVARAYISELSAQDAVTGK